MICYGMHESMNGFKNGSFSCRSFGAMGSLRMISKPPAKIDPNLPTTITPHYF